jgi:PAS domain S-box-containing protein
MKEQVGVIGSVCIAMLNLEANSLFDQMDNGVGIYGADGEPLFLNVQAAKYGPLYEANAAIGHLLYRADGITPLPQEEHPIVRLMTGEQLVLEQLWIKHNGRRGTGDIVLLTGKRLKNDAGEFDGMLVVTQDVTDRIWTETRLTVSEQRYKSMFEHNSDLVFWLDLEGHVLNINPAVAKITGYEDWELRGESFKYIITEAESKRTLEFVGKMQEGAPLQYDTFIFHKNGVHIDLHMRLLPMTVQGRTVGLYAIAQDVTARNHLRLL